MAINCTHSDFLDAARKLHGDMYDYSLVQYIDFKTPITIICPVHGKIQQAPYRHLKGIGCGLCGKQKSIQSRTKSIDTFITEANIVYGGKFDYSKAVYKNAHTKLTIICPVHGEFQQTPDMHLKTKAGCGLCANKLKSTAKLKTTKQFLIKAEDVHGTVYDYSTVDYTRSNIPVTIICPTHGEFQQTPSNHIHAKHKCPKCSYEMLPGYYSTQTFIDNDVLSNTIGNLYVIIVCDKNYNQTFIKVGITINSVEQRFASDFFNNDRFIIKILLTKHGKLVDIFNIEQAVLLNFKQYKLIPYYQFGGQTECFSTSITADIIIFINSVGISTDLTLY